MPWNPPSTWVAGSGVTAAALNAQVRDNLKAIGDPWTSYVPTWGGSVDNPSIGNGTRLGLYAGAGKLVSFRVMITAGSTTSFGSGQYSIGLPVASAPGVQLVAAEALIGSGAYRLHCRIPGGSSTVLLYCDPTTAGSSVRSVTATVPATFASGHSIIVQGTYEAA